MTITPAMAKKWLESNTQNRNLAPSKVRWFARKIQNGEFVLTHQGIAFDKNGKLLDGQHRLAAIVLAGIPVQMFVGEGFTRDDVIMAIDVGQKRDTADSLRIKYGGDTFFDKTIVSICREAARVKNRSAVPTENEIERFCFSNMDILKFAKHLRYIACTNAPTPVLLACIAAVTNGVAREDMERLVKLIYKNEIDVLIKSETNTAILNAAVLLRGTRRSGQGDRYEIFKVAKAVIYTQQKNLKRVPLKKENLYPIDFDNDLKIIVGV